MYLLGTYCISKDVIEAGGGTYNELATGKKLYHSSIYLKKNPSGDLKKANFILLKVLNTLSVRNHQQQP